MTKHKGVYYFQKAETARAVLAELKWPQGRVVEYKRGYAVQIHKSGPYLPDVICIEHHTCQFCPSPVEAE